ncbi:MAG: chromosomal replication initiator protein DnaA [bacterium]
MLENPNLTTIWQKVLNSLEVDLSPAVFNTFFRSTRVLKQENNIFTIAVSDTYQKENLELRYYAQIKTVLDDIVSEKTELIFKISAPQETEHKGNLGPLFKKEDNSEQHSLCLAKAKEAGLAPFYTFDSFIVGANNNVAHATAEAITKNPGQMYNPLFIYSGVGLGKTHLIQAIGNEIIKEHPHLKVLYCTGESFMNELLEAIGNRRTAFFRKKFRAADVWIIDDAQFIAGRESTQEEFFNTFNTLYQEKKQVILASDRAPRDISKLEERLSSRFAAGMITRLDPPDLEMRIVLLRQKRQENNFTVSDEILETVARLVSANIRELEGALLQVVSHAAAKKEPLSKEMVFEILGKGEKDFKLSRAPKKMIRNVAQHYDILIKDLKGRSRKADIVLPRQVCMYLLRIDCDLPLESVGELLGGRDHTTIMHGVAKIENKAQKDSSFKKEIHNLSTQF